ncbi:hypothetical protein Tco_0138092 [Tanacetum coccineum]
MAEEDALLAFKHECGVCADYSMPEVGGDDPTVERMSRKEYHLRWFKTYKSVNNGSVLHMGNESTALVHGRGCVDFRFSSGKIISLFNDLHKIFGLGMKEAIEASLLDMLSFPRPDLSHRLQTFGCQMDLQNNKPKGSSSFVYFVDDNAESLELTKLRLGSTTLKTIHLQVARDIPACISEAAVVRKLNGFEKTCS